MDYHNDFTWLLHLFNASDVPLKKQINIRNSMATELCLTTKTNEQTIRNSFFKIMYILLKKSNIVIKDGY